MEKKHTPEVAKKKPDSLDRLKERVLLKCKKLHFTCKAPKPLTSIIVLVLIAIAAGLFYGKALFVAATVNGSLISRLSVVQELEKQGGKQVLDSLISKKLIEEELKKQNISVTQKDIDDEISKIETQVTGQGGTLKAALEAQGMTEETLREQIVIQKGLTKLLADKTAVSETEIDEYMQANKASLPPTADSPDFRQQVSDQLQQQKFREESQKWLDDLKAKSAINYFVVY